MIANARFGAGPGLLDAGRLAAVADPDRLVLIHTGAIPDPVQGVSNDPRFHSVPAPGIGSAYYKVPGRVAEREITYTVRPMHWRLPWWTGAHGVIRRLRPTIMDDRQTPILRPVRTLRSAPVGPWDAGTALGPTGRATGAE